MQSEMRFLLGTGLIRVYTVAIPSAHSCRTAITGKGQAVLSASADVSCLNVKTLFSHVYTRSVSFNTTLSLSLLGDGSIKTDILEEP